MHSSFLCLVFDSDSTAYFPAYTYSIIVLSVGNLFIIEHIKMMKQVRKTTKKTRHCPAWSDVFNENSQRKPSRVYQSIMHIGFNSCQYQVLTQHLLASLHRDYKERSRDCCCGGWRGEWCRQRRWVSGVHTNVQQHFPKTQTDHATDLKFCMVGRYKLPLSRDFAIFGLPGYPRPHPDLGSGPTYQKTMQNSRSFARSV